MKGVDDLLHDLLHGEGEARYNAAVSLGARGDRRAAPVLRECLTQGEYWFRGQAVQLLGKVGDLSDLPQMVAVAVSEGDYEPRMSAAKGLKELDLHEATLRLLPYLSNDNPRIRRYAAETLGYMQAAEAVPRLVEALTQDTHRESRAAAATALGEIGDTSVVPILIEELKRSSDIQGPLIVALGELRDRRAVPVLLELFHQGKIHPDWGVYSWFAEALGLIADPAAVDVLIYIIENINDLVKDPVHDVAGEFSPARSVAYKYAVEAAGRIGGARVVDTLLRQLDAQVDGSNIHQPGVAVALGHIGDKRSVERLIKALDDDLWNLRAASAQALGSIGDPRAVEPLIQMMMRGESLDSYPAAEALEQIGTPEALAAATEWRQQQGR
jgi:HEAT repeat protein